MAGEVRLFLDSNVILSGLISSKGSPKILLDLLSIEVPLLKGMTGKYNLDEIERNLYGKFPELLPIYFSYLPKLRLEVIVIPPYREIIPLLGKMSVNDTPVLASARMGKAHYLITGNQRDFPKDLAQPIIVLSPTAFIEKILRGIISEES